MIRWTLVSLVAALALLVLALWWGSRVRWQRLVVSPQELAWIEQLNWHKTQIREAMRYG